MELRADERLEMLANLNNEEKEAEAITRMSALNVEIAATEGLNENYQIGASYFLKLKNIDFDQLWSDYLHPLLQEYIMVCMMKKVLWSDLRKHITKESRMELM